MSKEAAEAEKFVEAAIEKAVAQQTRSLNATLALYQGTVVQTVTAAMQEMLESINKNAGDRDIEVQKLAHEQVMTRFRPHLAMEMLKIVVKQRSDAGLAWSPRATAEAAVELADELLSQLDHKKEE